MNKLVLIAQTVLESLNSCGNSVGNDCIEIEKKNHSLLNSVEREFDTYNSEKMNFLDQYKQIKLYLFGISMKLSEKWLRLHPESNNNEKLCLLLIER